MQAAKVMSPIREINTDGYAHDMVSPLDFSGNHDAAHVRVSTLDHDFVHLQPSSLGRYTL